MSTTVTTAKPSFVRNIIFFSAIVLVVGCIHLLFKGYFPGPNGMGHDYSFFLPNLLANYYSIRMEGIWPPPWFTPAFCGGQPAFPDPQSIFYSLPQALTTFWDPIQSVYATLLTFVAAGFAGTYLFLRRCIGTSFAASIAGAVVFAMNGFFSHRMLIGHLAFHGIMLLPWLALVLTIPVGRHRGALGQSLLLSTVGALILAYWIISGMAVLVIPAAFAVVALILLYGLTGGSFHAVAVRAAVSMVLGLGITASKIAGTFAYTAHVPRTGYLLPGMSDVLATLDLAVTALFLGPTDIANLAAGAMTNSQFRMDRHEFEFSVTPVPFFLIALALAVRLYRALTQPKHRGSTSGRSIGFALALLLVLALPIALNTFQPEWNGFLKSLPIIGSASNHFRWFFIFIPVIAVATALALDSVFTSQRGLIGAASFAFFSVLLSHAYVGRDYYASQNYDPSAVSKAFLLARKPDFAPAIRYIGANVNSKGQILRRGSNDLLAMGASQLRCYNPMFGYFLESFPTKSLHPGDPMEVESGHLNVKNPACYVFPDENNCTPGAHFPADRPADAARFLRYQSFPFNRSETQNLADLINKFALVALAAIALLGFSIIYRDRNSKAKLNIGA